MVSIEQIRYAAIRQVPYLARALLSMQPVATTHQLPSTLCADADWNLYYQPEVLDGMDLDEAAREDLAPQVIIECVRLLQDHPQRLKALVPDEESGQAYGQVLSEIASTMVAAQLLSGTIPMDESKVTTLAHLPLGVQASLGPQPTVEDVLRVLHKLFPPPPAKKRPSGGQEPDQPPEQPPPRRNSQQRLQGVRNNKPVAPGAGSSVDGVPRPWEQGPQGHQQYSLQMPQGSQAIQQHDIQKQTAEAILRSQEAGREMAPPLVRWAKEHLSGLTVTRPTSFQRLLRQFTQTTRGYDLRRYDGRNRRQQQISQATGQQFCLARDRGAQANVMFVLDTSGSMDQTLTRRGLLWIASVLQTMQLDTTSCLYLGGRKPEMAMLHITRQAVGQLEIDGNGGTNMPGVIEAAWKVHKSAPGATQPNLIVCVTDGMTQWHFVDYHKGLPVPLVIALVNACDSVGGSIDDYAKSVIGARPIPKWAHLALIECRAQS